MVDTAIILAGGLGTRLRSVVPDVPKPMAEINGYPFLKHQMDYWIAEGIERFILSVGFKYECILEYFGTHYNSARLEYAIESTPLGTAGGLLLAADQLKSDAPFLLLNGDTYFTVDLQRLIAFAKKNDADWAFSLFHSKDVERYLGIGLSKDGRITSLNTTGEQTHLANGGVYLVNPRALQRELPFKGMKRSLEDDVFQRALTSGGRLFGLECPGVFIDIGLPVDYHRSADVLVGQVEA